jgi:tetratricopeptide (TPR) repeat protein
VKQVFRSSAFRQSAIESALQAQLGTEELNLFQSIAHQLVGALVSDLLSEQNSERPNILIFIDTLEKLLIDESWLISLIRSLPSNVLLVMAGRNQLSTKWHTLRTRIKEISVREFSRGETREAIRKFEKEYGITQIPIKTVRSIEDFSGGIPLAISLSAYLLLMRKTEQFDRIKIEAGSNLINAFISDVPKDFRRFIEVCARLRWVNEDALIFMLNIPPDDVKRIYDELQSSWLTILTSDGLYLHDRLRELILEEFKARSPESYKELAVKASTWFSHQLNNISPNKRFSNEWMRLAHEELVCSFAGLMPQRYQKFRNYFMEGAGRTLFSFCNSLISIVREDSEEWGIYYEGRLAAFIGDFNKVVEILDPLSRQINDKRLKAYVFDALGPAYYFQGKYDQLLEINLQSLEISKESAPNLIPDNLDGIGWAYLRLEKVHEASQAFDQGYKFAVKNDDKYWQIKHLYNLAAIDSRMGEYIKASKRCQKALDIIGGNRFDSELSTMIVMLQASIAKKLGDSSEAVEMFKEVAESFKKSGFTSRYAMSLANLGMLHIERCEYSEAAEKLSEGLQAAEISGAILYELFNLIGLLRLSKESSTYKLDPSYLQRATTIARRLRAPRLEMMVTSYIEGNKAQNG